MVGGFSRLKSNLPSTQESFVPTRKMMAALTLRQDSMHMSSEFHLVATRVISFQ